MVYKYDDIKKSIPSYQLALQNRLRHIIQNSTNRSDGDDTGIITGDFIELKQILNLGETLPTTDSQLLKTMISMVEVYRGSISRENAGDDADTLLASVIETEKSLKAILKNLVG